MGIKTINTIFQSEKTFEQIYDRKNNAFDIARFILATMVIYAHSFPLISRGNSKDIIDVLTKGQSNAGSLAVYSFFIISGFLITQSILTSKSYMEYLKKRFLRIMPAFCVSLLLCAFVIGPIVTNLDLHSYFLNGFKSGTNQPINFFVNNIMFNIKGYAWGIYDVFANNPYPLSINGSMWTLKHEVGCYLFLIVLSFFGLLKHRKLYIVYTLLLALVLISGYLYGFRLFNLPIKGFGWADFEYVKIINMGYYFTAGSLLFIFKDKILFSYKFLLLSILIIIGSLFMFENALRYALLLCLPYVIISMCVKYKFSRFTKYGDFSYGIYIYAFPIQQTIAFYFEDYLTVMPFFIASFIITFIMAVLSWKFIEKPALSLKNKKIVKKKSLKNSSKNYIGEA